MSAGALAFCVALHQANASVQLKLDDELGTHHGLGWSDYVLLSVLAGDAAGVPLRELMRPVGLPLSGVVRRLAPLEKTGALARETGADGVRRAVLRPGGRRLLQEAGETAQAVCGQALARLTPAGLASAGSTLSVLANSGALRLR